MLSLRQQPYPDALQQLTQLSGVGPKVAACIALFSCDKHAAIPVDTHVWALACKYYLPALKGKTLSPKLHPLIMQVRPATVPHALHLPSLMLDAIWMSQCRLDGSRRAAWSWREGERI
jgi:adenine-specific DNA glycosylase